MRDNGRWRGGFRLGGALFTLGVGAVMGLAAQASAAGLSKLATPYQNATIAAALARNPAGVRVAPAVVTWDRGDVVMTVPATPKGNVIALPASAKSSARYHPKIMAITAGSRDSCPAGVFTFWSCVYNQTNWNGTRLEFKDTGYYQDLYAYGGTNWVTLSWSNRASHRTWLNQYANHNNSGASLCMTGGGAGSNSFGPWSADRWIYLSTNTDHC
jgi:hypothetical protein